MILVDTKELMKQWKNVLEENNLKASVYTVQKLMRMKELPTVNLLIADECHHYSSKQYNKTVMKINSYYRIGLSATIHRDDNADLAFIGGLGRIVSTTNTKELIDKGTLAKPELIILRPEAPKFIGYNYPTAYKNALEWYIGVTKDDIETEANKLGLKYDTKASNALS